jgi:teichuronic acid exporter
MPDNGSLKQKTISGLTWSFIDSFSKQGITFVVGIILARLLTPAEFGLIGMITIFIAISQAFIDSGFSQALIRKNNATQTDYSTVFYFNLTIAVLLYIILFFSAGSISRFFKEPLLKQIIRILGLELIISALTIVQRTRLTKRIDFKLQTKISVISSMIAGSVGITMAFTGFGVWSLVTRTLTGMALTSLLLWIWNKWKPTLEFSMHSFREMFSFGSKLLASGLIDTAYSNIYLLIIGKFFSATELGYYTRADQFKNLPSSNINSIISRVSYPVMATIQTDIPKLKAAYQKLIKSTMLITFILMLGMAAVAKPLIITLIGDKWLPAAIYLQLLCFVGMFFPLHALNLNILKVQGKSDLFLKLEIIKKLLAIPTIVIGIIFGIKSMILLMIANSLVGYYLNSYWSGKLIGYSMTEQIKDILPSFILAAAIGMTVFIMGYFMNAPEWFKLLIQVFSGAILTFGLAEWFRLDIYIYLKEVALNKLRQS